MRTVSLAAGARIIGESEATLATWRHRKIGDLGKLGDAEGRDLQLELAVVARLALLSLIHHRSRDLTGAAAATEAWAEVLSGVFAGRFGDVSVYAVEVLAADGSVTDRFVAPGLEALAQAVANARYAASFTVINVSDLAARVQTGWLIATMGRDAARADLERHLEGAPELHRAAQLALFDHLFDRLADRIDPPKPPRQRKVKVRPPEPMPAQLPEGARRTSNGTLVVDCRPESVPAPAETSPKREPVR